jgi:hypothetical protein
MGYRRYVTQANKEARGQENGQIPSPKTTKTRHYVRQEQPQAERRTLQRSE